MKKIALYLMLLPIFFVLHGFVENFGFVGIRDCILLCLYYFAIAAILWAVSYLIFKNWRKSALFAFCLMSFYFFYGAVHDFLKLHVEWRLFSRHGFLLSTFLILFFVLFIYLKRSTKQLSKLTLFLNILLFVYICVDLVTAIAKSFSRPQNGLSIYHFSTNTEYARCDTCAKPDIYLLLFDEY